MKYLSLRARVRALAASLPPLGSVIRIEGGMPDDYAAEKPPAPPGIELQEQHRAFAKPAGAPKAAEIAPRPAKRA